MSARWWTLLAMTVAVAGCTTAVVDTTSTTTSPTTTTSAPSTTSTPSTVPTTTTTVQSLPSIEWVENYGGGGFDYGVALDVDDGGGVWAAADYRSSDSNNGDVAVLRYAPDGALMWAMLWGGPLEDHPLRHTIEATPDGKVVFAASMYDEESGDRDLAIVLAEGDGQIAWQRAAVGRPGGQRPHGVVMADDGSVYVTSHDDLAGEGHLHQILILKLDQEGEVIWQHAYQASRIYDTAYAMTADDAGGLVVAGITGSGEDSDVLAMKLDSDGAIVWSRTWGVEGSNERATDVRVDSDGAVYVYGSVEGVGSGGDQVFLTKLDADGALTWSRRWTLPDTTIWAHGLAIDESGMIVASGYAEKVEAGRETQRESGFLLGVDSGGSLLWQSAVGSLRKESIEGIEFDAMGRIVAVGQTARQDLSVAAASGQWIESSDDVVDVVFERSDPELVFSDPGFAMLPAQGREGGFSGSDAMLLLLRLP